MTLPTSFPLSMSQIAAELGLPLPLSLNHAWVEKLAGVSGLPLSFSQLLGKTGSFTGSVATTVYGNPEYLWEINLNNAPFFGGELAQLSWQYFNPGPLLLTPTSGHAPSWTGNVLVKNNTTGVSQVIPYISGSGLWDSATMTTNLIRPGATDNFSIIPSN